MEGSPVLQQELGPAQGPRPEGEHIRLPMEEQVPSDSPPDLAPIRSSSGPDPSEVYKVVLPSSCPNIDEQF